MDTIDINTHKQCVECKKWKPREEFYKLGRSPDKIHYYCKKCCNMRRAVERVRDRDKKSKISNRQQFRAKKLNVKIDSNITLAEVYKRDKGICAICKEPVQVKHASIDHITPLAKQGTHTWNNVQLTHATCNKRKGDRTNG